MTTQVQYQDLPVDQRLEIYRAYSLAVINDVSTVSDDELKILSWAFNNDKELREEIGDTNMYLAQKEVFKAADAQEDKGAASMLLSADALEQEGLFLPALTVGVLVAFFGGAAVYGAAATSTTAGAAMAGASGTVTGAIAGTAMGIPAAVTQGVTGFTPVAGSALLLASRISGISPSAIYHSTIARGTIVTTFLLGVTGLAAAQTDEILNPEENIEARDAAEIEAELDKLDSMAEAGAATAAYVGAAQDHDDPYTRVYGEDVTGQPAGGVAPPPGQTQGVTSSTDRTAAQAAIDNSGRRPFEDPQSTPNRTFGHPDDSPIDTSGTDPLSQANAGRFTEFGTNPYEPGSAPPILPPPGSDQMEGMDNPYIGVDTPHINEYGQEIKGYVAWRQGTIKGPDIDWGYWQTPRYKELDFQLLQSTMTEAEIVKFQERMVRAQYMNEDSVTGLLDLQTIDALKRILHESNVNGEMWQNWSQKVAVAGDKIAAENALDEEGNERANRIKARLEALGPFQRNTYLEPDYATLAEKAKDAVETELGRKINDWEMQLLTDSQSSFERQAFDATESVRSQNYNSQVRAIEQDLQAKATYGGGTVQDVDPAAQFSRTFDERFEKELDRKERTLGAGERSERLMSGLNNAMSAIGGR